MHINPSYLEQHRLAVGGLWDEIGQLQFNFLRNQGLKQEHSILDIGCGSLRGGIHFIKYLNPTGYCGIDASSWLLEASLIEIKKYGLEKRNYRLICDENFSFDAFDKKFDFALAQSVFTHLSWNSILRCLINLRKVLKPTGRFYFTFFEENFNSYDCIQHPGEVITYLDKDPFHYSRQVMFDLAIYTGYSATYIGDWNHPRNQKMIQFLPVS